MQVIRGLHNLREEHRGCVATIGNFDGVHLGHQAVFRHLREQGMKIQLPTVVVTFEPQPMEYFSPDKAPARLTRLREKLVAIGESKIDRVVLLEFGAKMAAMEAGEFVHSLLLDGLGVHHLIVGDDFRFGKDRAGDCALLQEAGRQHGFETESVSTFLMESERVSSTRVREALAAGELGVAKQCLGRPYRICGRVIHGDQRGRKIGFPTANINLHRRVSPLHGVFAVVLYSEHWGRLNGVANIGSRPTVDEGSSYLLEVHLFDFSGILYGELVTVEFVEKLREEQRFESLDKLRDQIEQDVQQAKECFTDASA